MHNPVRWIGGDASDCVRCVTSTVGSVPWVDTSPRSPQKVFLLARALHLLPSNLVFTAAILYWQTRGLGTEFYPLPYSPSAYRFIQPGISPRSDTTLASSTDVRGRAGVFGDEAPPEGAEFRHSTAYDHSERTPRRSPVLLRVPRTPPHGHDTPTPSDIARVSTRDVAPWWKHVLDRTRHAGGRSRNAPSLSRWPTYDTDTSVVAAISKQLGRAPLLPGMTAAPALRVTQASRE